MGDYVLSKRVNPPRTNFDVGHDGLCLDDVGEFTRLISSHLSMEGTTPTTPVTTPVYHSSTYVLNQPEDITNCKIDGGNCYSRSGNPTAEACEATINILERGAGSLTFASGMAAISTVLFGFLKQGDHMIIQIPSYPVTLSCLKHLVANFGIEITKVRDANFDKVVKNIKPNTKMIWLEVPCNPEIVVVDVRQMAEMARSKNILLAVDGTFAGPYVQRVVELGADFSVHSCTKYMGGHSDLLAGCVTTRTVEQWRRLKHLQGFLGNVLAPQVASLLHRSLKTLPLRMERCSQNAQKVAEYLEQHPKVKRVSYPGLPSHPQHKVASKQMRVYSGMIMAEIEGGGEGGRTVVMNTKLFSMALSLGGVESLIEHPYSMTHGPSFSDEERAEAGVTSGIIRISVGLEEPEDLIRDLDQSLNKVII